MRSGSDAGLGVMKTGGVGCMCVSQEWGERVVEILFKTRKESFKHVY